MAGNTVTLTFAGDASKLDKSMKDVGASAQKMAADVGKASDELGAGVEKGAGKFSGALGKLKAGAAVGGGAIAAGLSMAFANSLEFSAAQAKLDAQMGTGSEASKQAGAVAGQLYAGAYGENLAECGEAVRQVMQSGAVMAGASNEQVQGVTANVMSLAQAFGQDTTGAINAVAQMMRTGLAPDAQSALDVLTVGFQAGNDKAGDLLDTFNEYGTQFRKLGLDGKTAMGMITQGLQAGARDADIVADAIKEFSIRAIDGSQSTAAGFDAIGLSSQKMSAEIQKGGKPAAAALQLTLDKLRGMKDPGERAAAAVNLFGTQAEDLGDALYALNPATAGATAGMGQVDGAAQRLNDTLGDTAQSKIESVKRGFEEWSAKLVETKGPLGDVAAGVMAFGPQALGVLAPLGSMLAALRMQGAVGALAATKAEVAAVGATAQASSARVGRFSGALKGIGVGLALGAVAVAMDKINESSEGGNLSGWNGELHDLSRIMTGDWGNPLEDIGRQWDEMGRNIVSGQSPLGKALGWIKQQLNEPLPPMKFDVNTGPAVAQVDGFINSVNSQSPQVNINGNTNGAGFALRTILDEIAAGHQSVTIDGQSMPAQQALSYVEGLINNSNGVVDINGNKVPAGQALSSMLDQIRRSRENINVGANTAGIGQAISQTVQRWNGYTIRLNGVVSSRIGGLATGGPVSGPGTGTSDTAGVFALSDGEYVATAAQVQAAGGPDAFGRLLSAVEQGRIGRMASGGPVPVMRAPLAAARPTRSGGVTTAGPVVSFQGNTTDALATVIMQMVRTGKIQIKAA